MHFPSNKSYGKLYVEAWLIKNCNDITVRTLETIKKKKLASSAEEQNIISKIYFLDILDKYILILYIIYEFKF